MRFSKREFLAQSTSLRRLWTPRLNFRKNIVLYLLILVFIVYILMEYVNLNDANRQVNGLENTMLKERSLRRSLCRPVKYPNLTFGPNRTSAYHSPNASLVAESERLFSGAYNNYSDFKLLLQSMIGRRLIRFGDLPINALFVGQPFVDIPHPLCDGLWLEFVSSIPIV